MKKPSYFCEFVIPGVLIIKTIYKYRPPGTAKLHKPRSHHPNPMMKIFFLIVILLGVVFSMSAAETDFTGMPTTTRPEGARVVRSAAVEEVEQEHEKDEPKGCCG